MQVKRFLALAVLACGALGCSRPKAPTVADAMDATTDAPAEAAAAAPPALYWTDAGCYFDESSLRKALGAGGSGTGLAQDATVQAIIALYGVSIPQGGSGTGLCQDASLQALYLLIAAQLDAGGGSSSGGGRIDAGSI